jgi:hypothetical protein
MAFSLLHGLTRTVPRRLAVSLAIFLLVFGVAAALSYRPRQISHPVTTETDMASTAPAIVLPKPIAPQPEDTAMAPAGATSIHHEFHHARSPTIADAQSRNADAIIAPPHLPLPANPMIPADAVVVRTPVDIAKYVAFNKPATLYVDEPSTVQAILSSKTLTVGALKDAFSALPGDVKQSAAITVGAYISAKLTAPVSMLDITAEDANLRKVDGNKDITFVWYVKPLRTGMIPIDLAIYSQDKPEAGSPVERSKVMQENWTAEAHGLSGLLYWINAAEPVRVEIWTLAGGLASVLTFFGLTKFGAAKPTA